jgi:hypothetical protein
MPRDIQNLENLLISVDCQPQYKSGCTFELPDFVRYMKKFSHVLYLFNDYKISVPDTIDSVIDMLKTEGNATDDDIKHIRFCPKQYWYFRDLTDNPNIPYENLVKLLKMLILRGVEKANDLSKNDLLSCLNDNMIVNQILSNKLKFYYDPKLALTLSRWRNATLVGGFEFQCLLEICIYLDALGIPYEKNHAFIY